ncbi:fatty acyl-CoA hydrolase precursor, medium chain-like [Lineus longissimus]|uniref:fatty acyl-CoA hydrolase precursor, medium chain-like n=1 Tax=Lineus longissimus TaxID=88925 RepID=UPI00315CA8A8
MRFAHVSSLLVLICAHALISGVQAVAVTTSVGDIVGFDATWGDKALRKFHGIPFAEAPIRDLRFSPPVPKMPFSKPFGASKFGSPCPQLKVKMDALLFSTESQNSEMSEDCLSLNIYVPSDGADKKPVMVWIHGGGLTEGTGMQYDGSKMAVMGDVIVVTINYRLGLLGFFSTGDEYAAGNYGLLDQQLALKWVQQNIGAFGGDKDKVTIFGESAGSGAVTWLMLAPSNEGLFQRAIAESGTALSSWGLPDPKLTMQYSDVLISNLGCAHADSSQVMKCLRGLTLDSFAFTTAGYPHAESLMGKIPVGPRVDRYLFPYSPTSRKPSERMEDLPFFRSVDLLIGANKYEVAMAVEETYPGVSKEVFGAYVDTWGVAGGRTDQDVVDALWWLYGTSVNGNTTDKMQARYFLEFVADSMFYDGINKFVKRHASESEATETTGATFFYSFLAKPGKVVGSLGDTYFPTAPWTHDGAVHGDEMGYLFGPRFGKGTIKEKEKQMEGGEVELAEALITYWTNFAKTGDPNKPVAIPHLWPQYKIGEEEFIEFDIHNKQLEVRTNSFYRNRYMSFWNDVITIIQDCPVKNPRQTSEPDVAKRKAGEAKTEL